LSSRYAFSVVRALARGLFAKQREQRAAGSKGIAMMAFDRPEELGKSVKPGYYFIKRRSGIAYGRLKERVSRRSAASLDKPRENRGAMRGALLSS
jgi:hypothetical protein